MPIKIDKRTRATASWAEDADKLRQILMKDGDVAVGYADGPDEEPWCVVLSVELYGALRLLADAAEAATSTASGEEEIRLRAKIQQLVNERNGLRDTILQLADEVAELRGTQPPSERMWRSASSLAQALRPDAGRSPWEPRRG